MGRHRRRPARAAGSPTSRTPSRRRSGRRATTASSRTTSATASAPRCTCRPTCPTSAGPSRGPKLVAGLALAVEPMVTLGTTETDVLADDWTVVTADGSMVGPLRAHLHPHPERRLGAHRPRRRRGAADCPRRAVRRPLSAADAARPRIGSPHARDAPGLVDHHPRDVRDLDLRRLRDRPPAARAVAPRGGHGPGGLHRAGRGLRHRRVVLRRQPSTAGSSSPAG